MGFTRDPDSLFDCAIDIAAHRVRERAVVDSQHHLEVEEEASHVEIRRSDVDDVVEDEQLGVQLGRLVFVDFDAALEQQPVTVAGGAESRPICGLGRGYQEYAAAPSDIPTYAQQGRNGREQSAAEFQTPRPDH